MRSVTESWLRRSVVTSLSVGALTVLLSACEREVQILSPDGQGPVLSALVGTTDPAGDAVASHGNGLSGEAYQDIVGAAVDLDQATFTFTMQVATNVPTAPVLPGGITVQEWSWNISTSPEQPRGFPFATGGAAPPEFLVMVSWDGRGFAATLIDRRPLLTGNQPVSTPIPFAIDGAAISTDVSASLLGNPSSFTWVARTNNWPHLGSGGVQTLDRAPNDAPGFWP